MSDSQNNVAPESVESADEGYMANPRGFSTRERLEAILADRSSRTPAQVATYTPGPSSVRYNGVTGEVTTYGEGGAERTISAAALEADEPQSPEELLARAGRLRDDPTRSLEYTWQGYVNQLMTMAERINAHTFDPVTGKPIYRIQGSQREQAIREFNEFRKTVDRERITLGALRLQRERDAALKEQAARDQAQAEHDRRLRAAIRADELLVEEEAKALVEQEKKRRAGSW